MFESKTVTLDELILDTLNPRFTTRENKNFTEDDIIKYLIEYEELIDLARSINEFGGFIAGERIIVVEDNATKKYIVLEGNRRISSLKLLTKNKALSKNTPKISNECLNFTKAIPVDVVSSREQADYTLLIRHIDGIKMWSPLSKMKFYNRLFENGQDINSITSISPDPKNSIIKLLQKYDFLVKTLEIYDSFNIDSNFLNSTIDAKLDTDFLTSRIFSYFTKKNTLNLKFSTKNYSLLLPKDTSQRNILLGIFAAVAKLYWEEKVIHSRILNTQSEIKDFFEGKTNKKTHHLKDNHTYLNLLNLLKSYDKNSEVENFSGIISNSKGKIPTTAEKTINKVSTSCSQLSFTEEILPLNGINSHEINSTVSLSLPEERNSAVVSSLPEERNSAALSASPEHLIDDNFDSKRFSVGRKYKDKGDYDMLLKAYPFKNKFRQNNRINSLLKELSSLEYKKFGISTNFLMRSLLESYAFEYTQLFSNRDLPKEQHLKGLTSNNFTDKDLNEKFSQFIAQHIGKIKDGQYATTQARILTLFDKSNKISITQKLNSFVHSPDSNPMYLENLESWENISIIISTMDKILFDFTK